MSDKHGEVFIDNFDKEKFTGDIEIIKKDKGPLLEISNKICGEFTSHLDKHMQELYLTIKENKLDDKTLEIKFLELTNLIYFLGDKLEALNIELTVASARNQEIYNRIYQEAEGTIKDKQAQAEEGSKYEYLLKAVYESVYKRIKLKLEAAYEMVSSCKNVLKSRISEKSLTNRVGNLTSTRAAYGD